MTTLQVVDVPTITEITRVSGWEGIVHPGFPTAGNLIGLYGRWGDPSSMISMYRPAGWDDKWKAIITEADEGKRMDMMREIIKIAYDNVVAIPYRANSPLKVDDGTVRDPNLFLHVGMWPDIWWPERIWLDK